MRMRDKNCFNPVLLRDKPTDIGQNQIHPRGAIHIGKADAKIHHDQPFSPFWPIAINIGIHANFTGSPEGKVNQSLTAHEPYPFLL